MASLCPFFFFLPSSGAPAPRHEQDFTESHAYSSHIPIISSKAETNLCNEVWPVLTDQTLSRGAGHVATTPQSTPKTQLNNQGFNCRIIPQSIKKGFLGCWMKLNRAPQETNTQSILARQMRRSETSGGWGWIKRRSHSVCSCSAAQSTSQTQNKLLFMPGRKHTQTRHLNTQA